MISTQLLDLAIQRAILLLDGERTISAPLVAERVVVLFPALADERERVEQRVAILLSAGFHDGVERIPRIRRQRRPAESASREDDWLRVKGFVVW